MSKQYRVVRSYGPNSVGKASDLEAAFRAGYQFERASEYVEGDRGSAGYIEYILYKEVNEEDDC